METLTFAQPWWIAVGAATVPALWLLWRRFDAAGNQRLQRFASARLLPGLTSGLSPFRRGLKKTLVLAALGCCFVALARPQYGYRWIDVKHKGIDILFALDTSRSMLATDTRPNRLERTKLAVMDFVSQLSGDRVGLLPFAGSAFLVCPLTSDYHAFEESLMAVNTEIIPAAGTDIGAAIAGAEKVLRNEANHKILVLLTDGEELQGSALEEATRARQQKLVIHTVGIGSRAGELVPDPDSGGFLKDSTGNFVKSRLDEAGLTAIAEATGGMYVPLGNNGQGLERIYRENLALIPKQEFAEKRRKIPLERYRWPLAAAVVLLAGEFLISGRKPGPRLARLLDRFSRKNRRTAVLLLMLVPALCWPAGPVSASPGEEAYRAGNLEEATAYYREQLAQQPGNPAMLYNSGVIAYRRGHFGESATAFRRALVTGDLSLQQQVFYNLGNSLFRQGQETLQADPAETVRTWKQALEAYDGCLALNPADQDAAFNRNLVRDKLEQLEQQLHDQQRQSPQESSEEDQDSPGEPDSREQSGTDSAPPDQDEKGSPNDQNAPEPEPQPAASGRDQTEPDNGQSPAGQPTPSTAKGTPESSASSAPAAAAGDAEDTGESGERAPLISRAEAEKLLQALQDEEGRLNLYLPLEGSSEPKQTDRNW